MTPTMNAAEAARRLGVRRETLYAYVSRGMLTSHRQPGTKESRFDLAEVEALAARTRSGGRAGARELVVDSSITLLEPEGRLFFRGQDATVLATSASFEEVAELLWTARRPDPAPCFEAPLELQRAARRACASLGKAALPVDRLRTALVAASIADPLRFDRSPDGLASAGRRILAIEAAAAAPGRLADERSPIAERLFAALAGRPGRRPELAALDAALVLLADHELASSTLGARIAASTWADPYLVVSAGLAVLGGPLHGSAGDRVAAMLCAALERGAAQTVADRWRLAEPVMGFGHVLYVDRDPRAEALWPLLELAWPRHHVVAVAGEISALVTTSFRNIDFAVGTLVAAAGMASGSAEAIFALARTAGWLAHAGEEYAHHLRYRIRAAYTGPSPPSVAAGPAVGS